MSQVFSIPVRIYWEDTDAGGVVYHSNFLKFFERARSDWLSSHGFSQPVLQEQEDLVFTVRAAEIDWKRPARLGDDLIATSQITEARGARLRFEHELKKGDDVLCRAVVHVVCLRFSTFRPIAVPQKFLDLD